MRARRFAILVAAAGIGLTGIASPAPAVASHTEAAALPDLTMQQPSDFRLERKSGGRRWLRFSTVIANIGRGAFDAYGFDPGGNTVTTSSRLKVRQRLEDIDAGGSPTWSAHETAAEMTYSGDGHNHFHVLGLQRWDLAFDATPNDVIATGAKTGFCFWDNVDLPEFDTTKHYQGTWACQRSPDLLTVPMGLTVGWGDRYPWNIAYQYIDVSHLPNGTYCLAITADPLAQFIEADVTNNTVRTLISIKASRVTVLAPDCG